MNTSNTSKNVELSSEDLASLDSFCVETGNLIEQARNRIYQTANVAMVYTYYEIGRRIVNEEQGGADRASYGKRILQTLSAHLTERFGKGFSVGNLKLIRQFYRVFSDDSIGQTVFGQFENLPKTQEGRVFPLSWSHYVRLMRIENVDERRFYEIEAAKNNWSLSELNRQFDSALYERLALSRDKHKVKELSEQGQVIERPSDLIKDPYILEFAGLEELSSYSETKLETCIIDNLQNFLLELGTGFTFVGRQQRVTFEGEHFWVDLVFFNRILSCFVLIDLKIGRLSHKDLGQMQMYVNYYDRTVKLDTENPTIGIVLCKDKNDAVVEMTLPEDNAQIFASKFKTVLPSKKALHDLLNKSQEEYEMIKLVHATQEDPDAQTTTNSLKQAENTESGDDTK